MGFLDLIFPKKCLECGQNGKYICLNCIHRVTPCGYRNGNFAIFEYKGVIRKAIIALKYKFAYDLVDELVGCALRVLKSNKSIFLNLKSIVLVPIPLHKTRENFRGFNQTKILGEKIAKEMSWKYIPDLLVKPKETRHQVGLKGDERRKNLQNVFAVNTNHFISNHYPLVLFDDVYTTGTTINEAKKVLQSAGFKNIKSLTIAG
jgi:ComF family protein